MDIFLIDRIISITLYFTGETISLRVYSLLTITPLIAVGMRRMHDIGKSGGTILIPFYGIILALMKGDDGANKYGKDPRIIELQKQNEPYYNVIMSFLIAAFIACGTYALLSETRIIDGFQWSLMVKNIISIVFFIMSFVFLLITSFTNKDM